MTEWCLHSAFVFTHEHWDRLVYFVHISKGTVFTESGKICYLHNMDTSNAVINKMKFSFSPDLMVYKITQQQAAY